MTTQITKRTRPRLPLTRERVLEAALKLADRGGLEGLSMRKLGQALGVEAMALYYHFTNKERVLDGIVDLVFAEIDLPKAGEDWKVAMRRRAISIRNAMARHRWAIGLMESRTNPGPANLRHHDAVIGCFRAAGFDMAATATAYSLLDSYIYGFAMTKMNLPFEDTSDIVDLSETMLAPFAPGEYQNLADFITEHAMKPGYDFANEFESGLDVILDGLERLRATGRTTGDEVEREPTAALEALLVQTGEAHGAFEETELQGVYDQEWPRWYAMYAVEHGLGALVGDDVTVDRLAAFLASSNVEYEQIQPELREPWATYTARRIAAAL